MAEFFKWLEANPVAAVFLSLVVVVFVAVFVVAALQGREISLWPPRISTKSHAFRQRVQIGDVQLPREKPKEFYDGSYSGRRGVHAPVKFETPFEKYVKVTASLQLIDVGGGGAPIARVLVAAANVTLTGFDLYFETWEDSKLFGATASWVAVGE